MKYIIPKHLADKMDNAYGAIYMWINLHNNHKYIGQAMMHRLSAREHEHATTIDGCTLLNKAIKKYGHFNFLRIVIDVAYSAEELNEKEKYWIAKHNTFKGEGYNCTEGGEGGFGKGENHPCFKGYVLAIEARTGVQKGVYEGVLDASIKLSSEKKQVLTASISHVLTGRAFNLRAHGFYFARVSEEVYQAYCIGNVELIQEEADKHVSYVKTVVAERKAERKAIKERKKYVEKMQDRTFIVAISSKNGKPYKTFKSNCEVARAFGVAEGTIRYNIKIGASCCGYFLKRISFKEYEMYNALIEYKKFILAESTVPYKQDKVFTNQTDLAIFLGISQSQVSRRLQSEDIHNRIYNDYQLSFITFEEYEALAN